MQGPTHTGRALFGKVRYGVVLQLFGDAEREMQASDLAHLIPCPVAAVRRELTVLARGHLILKSVRDGRTWYRADRTARLFAALHLLAQEENDLAPAPGGERVRAPSRGPRRVADAAPARRLTADLFDRHYAFIAIAMNEWVLRHMARVYATFESDLVAALVLGEIAHHNVSRLAPALDYDRQRIRDALAGPDALHAMLPCNAFSISEATRIPRETVRRKVKDLVASGWLTRTGRGELFITPEIARHFGSLTFATATDLLEVVDKVRNRVFRHRDDTSG